MTKEECIEFLAKELVKEAQGMLNSIKDDEDTLTADNVFEMAEQYLYDDGVAIQIETKMKEICNGLYGEGNEDCGSVPSPATN